MRGELCIGSATFLSLAAFILLIFMHVGQINPSTVPRNIAMMKVNVTGYGAALAAATAPDPVDGLYTNNASTPLGQHLGLRNLYDFGLYSHCAYVNTTHGKCTATHAATKLQPYDAITSDMPINYTGFTHSFIANVTFADSQYLGDFSNGAYYLLLLGSIATTFALVTGLVRHALAFLVSTVFAVVASLFLLIGAIIWTVIVKKAQDINSYAVPFNNGTLVPVGIDVSVGSGLLITWASFACIIASIIPYMISCCTYRG